MRPWKARKCDARSVLLGAAGILAVITPVRLLESQAPAGKPSFEVASVKPSSAGDNRVAIRAQPGGRYTATNATLKMVIGSAYRIRDYQISGGPSWIATDRWNIEGKAEEGSIPPGTGPPDPSVPDPLMLMVQSLLEDRFQLKAHRESRDAPVYELAVAKTGPKMKLSANQEPVVFGPHVPQGGGPPRGMMRLNPRTGNLEGNGVPIATLAQILSEQAISGRPVIDKTGLKGLYDFTLEWVPEAGLAAPGISEPAAAACRQFKAFTIYRHSRAAWTEAGIRQGDQRVFGH
jgi:bla regulator protein blaR1